MYEEDEEDDNDDNDDDSGGGDVKEYIFCMFNPLSPKSDRHQISPYNINALENRVVMRIEYMIREDESNWYFNKFSPLLLLKKYRDSKWESQFWS